MSNHNLAVSDTQPIRKPTIPKDAAVLVVEDNVSNFVLIARMLGYLGIHCEWKTSGYEVVEYADTLPRLDLILMDIRLPYEDGYGALKKIRASGRPTPGRSTPPWACRSARRTPTARRSAPRMTPSGV